MTIAVAMAARSQPGVTPRNRSVGWWVPVLALSVAFFAGFSAVSVRNFGGWDEWLVVSLSSKGITDLSYANRPLALVWALPGALLLPWTLAGYWVAHALNLWLGGVVVVAIVRCLAPKEPALALLSGAVALLWVPMDATRLNPVNNVMYSGATLAALVSLLCLVLWACGRGVSVLAMGMALVAVASRSYEGTLGLIAGGGCVLILALGQERRRPVWQIVVPWGLVLLLAVAAAILPLLGAPSYQVSGLGMDASPAGMLSRIGGQMGWHLGPLVAAPPPSMLSWRAVLAGFAVGVLAFWRGVGGSGDRRRLVELAGAGLLFAISGWGPMLMSSAISGPARMQGFSAPGVGLFLGSSVLLVAGMLPVRWRTAGCALLGAWLGAAGTGHTLALQQEWDGASTYPRQAQLLRGLVGAVPAVKAPTLIVLLDDEHVFQAGLSFRHAVEYLYDGRALGIAPGAYDFLYPIHFAQNGVVLAPWPAIRVPWNDPVRLFGYHELIVVRHRAGTVTLLDRWPAPPLLPLKEARAYAPRTRIVPGPVPAGAALLAE